MAKRGWVSVKDECPEQCVTVLLWTVEGWCVTGWYEGGVFRNAYDESNVTHWRPLPKPPSGKRVKHG